MVKRENSNAENSKMINSIGWMKGIKNITVSNFKFESSFYLIFLNKLLNNDTKRFQFILKKTISDEREIDLYLNFFIRYFLYGNFLYEISKTEEIDSSAYRSNLTYDLFSQSVKFIQNLCEDFLSESILKKEIVENVSAVIKCKDGELIVKKK